MDRFYDGPVNDVVLSLLRESDRDVLDLGCGAGANASRLRAHGFVVDGVTSSRREADSARAFCRRVHVHDLETGLPDGLASAYDVVLASHVLEHLRSPTRLLNDVRRLMDGRDTRLLVAIPNVLYYKNRLALLSGRIEYHAAGLMDETHYKWYTYDSCQCLLSAHGFEVETRFGDGSAPLWFLRRMAPAGLRTWLDASFSRWRPGLFGYQLVFVARASSK